MARASIIAWLMIVSAATLTGAHLRASSSGSGSLIPLRGRARPPFVATERSPIWDEATLPPVRFPGPRRLTRFLDFTMNNSPYFGLNATKGPTQGPRSAAERTLTVAEWYNETTNATPQQFADIAATLKCDAFEYDVMNDGSGSDGGNGHTAFFSPTGPVYPALLEKGLDFFGELSKALKAKGMEVFVYMPIAYNHHFAMEHPEAGWMVRNHSNGTNGQNHGSPDVPGSNSGRYSRCQNISCLNYPGYIELVANYTRQVIEQYQPAAVRYDGWQMTIDHHCEGCKQFYRELYGEELPETWRPEDWRRQYDFQRATTTRAIEVLRSAATQLDPSILTWANGIMDNQDWELNSFDAMRSSLNTGFNEGFGSTWAEGVFGQMLMLGMTATTPGLQKSCVAGQWMQQKFESHRNVFAVLNGLMYEYSGLNIHTALPVLSDAYIRTVNETYGLIEDLDPMLQ
jgi:hypothetical protein